jgi:hypothetical protein
MKRPLIAMAAALAVMALAGCTHYHTTEYRPVPVASRTVVVPPPAAPPVIVQQRSPDVVLAKPVAPDSETVTVAPDSTVTVTRPNNN